MPAAKILLIFDLDGTLIDSRADLTTAINLTRLHFDLAPLSRDEVVRYVGNGMVKLVERSLTDAAVPIEQAVALTRKNYREHMLDETQPYEGVHDALERLKDAGYRMALVTNKPEQQCCLLHGLRDN